MPEQEQSAVARVGRVEALNTLSDVTRLLTDLRLRRHCTAERWQDICERFSAVWDAINIGDQWKEKADDR